MNLNKLKEIVDELIELNGVGDLEIYQYGSNMYAEKVNNVMLYVLKYCIEEIFIL